MTEHDRLAHLIGPPICRPSVRSRDEVLAELGSSWTHYERLSDADRALVDAERYLPVAETRALFEKYRDRFYEESWLKRLETLDRRAGAGGAA